MGSSSIELPPCNEEGFLNSIEDWSESVCEVLARAEGIELTEAHWEVIQLLRKYYTQFDSSPAMRALVKYVSLHLGQEKGRSIYLLKLFPESPARVASKLAGLPKPANCL
ncbi:MAG: TusE/DsrC/DsvC family sulfur relay protein [Pseudomonadota bacterium]